jgi:hypothetical protein
MNNAAHEHLVETWYSCRKAATWLERSHRHSPVPPFAKASDAEWDQLEALAGRFARLTDLIIHKLLRALDRYELEDTGTLLDSANRAERRGLVASADVLREFKDLRNEIVHEYSTDDLASLYEEIYAATPDLLELFSRIESYLSNNHLIEPGNLR